MQNNGLERTSPMPAEILALFGPPPVLTKEAAKVYESALTKFATVIKPRDFIELIYVNDLTDHWFEIWWLRGLKVRLIKREFAVAANREWKNCEFYIREFCEKSAAELASKILELKGEPDKIKCESERLEAEAKRNNKVQAEKMRRETSERLQKWNLMEIDANLFREWSGYYEHVEKFLLIAEKKFENTLRRVDEYKHGFGERLRKASNEVIDGEIQEELDPLRTVQAPAADSSVAPVTCAEAPLSEQVRDPEPSITTRAEAPLSEQVPAAEPSVTVKTSAEAPLSPEGSVVHSDPAESR